MSIGDHDKRVLIQKRTGEADALGNITPMWIDDKQRWASIMDQGGSELYRAQKVDPTVSVVVGLREQYSGLNPKDRVKYGDRVFNIKAVLGASDRTPKRGQMLACTEEVA